MNEVRQRAAVRLLLVEDNGADVRLMRENLKAVDLPTHLDVVGDGDDALRFLRRQAPYLDATRPDFILLDLHLPRKDGFAVLAELEKDRGLGTIPVVVCLGSGLDKERLKEYRLPADCLFVKGYDPEALRRILTNCTARTNGNTSELLPA
jgi:two-component system, chemotaxis family, response regulator Rcp1